MWVLERQHRGKELHFSPCVNSFVRVTLSKVIRVLYPEENNELSQLWEQQGVHQLFGGFPLGKLSEHKEKLHIKQILSTSDKSRLFLGRDWGLSLVKNIGWDNWELETDCWGLCWSPALWGSLLQDIPRGTAIPQRQICVNLTDKPPCSGSVGFALLWQLWEDPWEATHGRRITEMCTECSEAPWDCPPPKAEAVKMSLHNIRGTESW